MNGQVLPCNEWLQLPALSKISDEMKRYFGACGDANGRCSVSFSDDPTFLMSCLCPEGLLNHPVKAGDYQFCTEESFSESNLEVSQPALNNLDEASGLSSYEMLADFLYAISGFTLRFP